MLNGVSRVKSTSLFLSFKVISAALIIRLSAYPLAIPERVFMLQGAITMPDTRKEPLAISDERFSLSNTSFANE